MMTSERMMNFIKIFFPLVRDEDGWPPADVELIWSERQEDGYRIDNIPVYAPLIAYGDIVTAAIENGRLEFTGVVRRSGHGNVRIIAYEEEYMPGIEEDITALGCAFEPGPISTFLAIDIPPMKDYAKIMSFLESGLREERFEYEEALVWW